MKRLTAITGIVLGLGLAIAVYALPNVVTLNNGRSVATAQITNNSTLAKASFAGGCFWCVEAAFEKVPGVAEVISGYSGGEEVSPTYQQVASGSTGHTEAVEVYYDASVVSYEGLLETLWRTANPTDITGQFVDRGQQYRPEIFYHDESQLLAANLSKQNLSDSGRYDDPVVIAITPATAFYAAEDYHQDYYKKNPVRYKLYTRNSGRYQFIDSVWTEGRDVNYASFQPDDSQVMSKSKESSAMNDTTADMDSVEPFNGNAFVKPSDRELKEKLSSIEYKVTQKDGTERAFSSPMHDEKRVGLYVDVVSGEPLFSSSDKFDSGTGWPSFDRPIARDVVIEKSDRSLFGVRTEIRSALADSHLGHVFTDGPASTGNRYCMNAAAMRFVPLESMAEAGYGDFIARVTGGST